MDTSMTRDIIVSYINNETVMMVALIATFVAVSIDKSLNHFQKKMAYLYAITCLVYTLLAFVDFSIGSLLPGNTVLRMICVTTRYLIRPLPIVFFSIGLSEKLKQNKAYYLPWLLNVILLLINVKIPILFSITADSSLVTGSLIYSLDAILCLYTLIIVIVLIKNPLFQTMGTKVATVIIFMMIPLSALSELRSQRNVLGTAMLLAVLMECELLIVAKNNIELKDKDQDIEKQKVALLLTQKASMSDEMTGALNRRAYDLRMEQEILRGEVPSDFAIVMCDINGLKVANDTLGHQAGDALIIGAAKSLQAAFGRYGDVYRIGGDEFAVMLRCNEQQLLQSIKNLNTICEHWTNPLVSELSISKGYANASGSPGMNIKELVVIADQKMYEDKKAFYQTHADRDRRSR